jgi:hypothetical protein
MAAHAAKLAHEHLDHPSRDSYDYQLAASSAVISVALTQAVGPLDPAYSATLSLTGHVMRGQTTGADSATWSLENFEHSDKSRSEHAARLRLVADVVEASEVDLEPLHRTVQELRAYAAVYEPKASV